MAKKKKQGNRVGELEEYLKANRRASRIEELERNGGRWVATHRIHKNMKAYDRKRDRKIEVPFVFLLMNIKKHPLFPLWHSYCNIVYREIFPETNMSNN